MVQFIARRIVKLAYPTVTEKGSGNMRASPEVPSTDDDSVLAVSRRIIWKPYLGDKCRAMYYEQAQHSVLFFIFIGLVLFSLREVSALPPAVITGDIIFFLYMIMSVEDVLSLLLTLPMCACRCAGSVTSTGATGG